MEELIRKLEAATEGSRELDAEIGVALFPVFAEAKPIAGERDPGTRLTEFGKSRVQPYTTSIDAALTLVPAKMSRLVYIETCQPAKAGYRKNDKSVIYYEASSPALALCIAALRARQQGEG